MLRTICQFPLRCAVYSLTRKVKIPHNFKQFRSFSISSPLNIFKSPLPSPGVPNLSSFSDYLLEDALERHKDIALVHADSGETITYGQLREKAFDLAIQYYIRGWEQGHTIAIILNNKAVYPLTVFAAAKVGMKVILVDSRLKPRMWIKQLRHCNADYIVTTAEILHYVRDVCQSLRTIKEILVLNREDDERDKKEYRLSLEMKYDLLLGKPPGWGALPDWVIKPEEGMFLSYTPLGDKGIELTHAQVTKSLLQIKSIESEMGPNHIVAITLPYRDIFNLVYSGCFPFLQGAKTVIIEKMDPKRFFEVVQQHKVTFAHVAPDIITELAEGQLHQDFNLSTLRVLMCTQYLDVSVYDKLEKRFPGLKLKQGYGIPELTPPIFLTPTSKIKKGSVGILVPDTEAKLIDPNTKKELGYNEEGELWVKGDQIMSEWYQNPDETALSFDSEGFFRTGDKAKVDEDGYWWISKPG